MSTWDRVGRFIKSQLFLNIIMLLMLLFFVPFLVIVALDRSELARYWLSTSWDWLIDGESGSTTIRNLGLVLAGLIALPLAIWRSIVAQRQAETAERGLLNERYQKSVEMLGSEVLAVRLGGIYALQRLAWEHPEQYHIQVMQVLCAFLRHPTKDEKVDTREVKAGEALKARQDVDAVMLAINSRRERQLVIERSAEFALDLRGADLRDVYISANLSGAFLWEADLSGAYVQRSNLSRSFLNEANLFRTELSHSNLSGARLLGTNLSGALLCGNDLDPFSLPVFGLTQTQLDDASADPDNPPKLDGVLDAETGEPLVWRGKPCQ